MNLSDEVTKLSGVGEVIARKLSTLGISTIEELLMNFPRRYDDYSTVVPINQTKPGSVTIKAKISQTTSRRARRGLHITEALASDKSGSIYLVWFNQPYRATSLKDNTEYFISGEFGLHRQRMSMINPSIEVVSSFPINTARIIPIYRETKGLSSLQIRKAIKSALGYLRLVKESLPEWLLHDHQLIALKRSIETMHFPASIKDLNEAKQRLGFEELFDLSLAALMNKNELLKQKAPKIPFNQKLAVDFVKNLPFKLTGEQRSAAWRILQDIEKDTPMNRLLEGDVGTGKTVVACMAAYIAISQGFQVSFMAPTEILARQHANTIYKVLKPFNLSSKVGLLVGSQPPKQKNLAINKIASGELGFIIGTHSLIQEGVKFKNLGLVIIDEQHRFGVQQRQAMGLKSGLSPHVLSMSATPIPRSLQLTLYGDLDISIIKHKPYSNLAVKTLIKSLNERTALYESQLNNLSKGKQLFVVCPLIADSSGLPFRSAQQVYDELRMGVYKHYRVGLLHGRLKSEDKEKVMNDFVANKINVLVATTIIEVGVDVPNANCIIIESAERFGLTQIHQLRGRVGRSDDQGFCYLLLDDDDRPSVRLRALETTTDGFKLAELDLKIRGPGAIYGVMQHGHDGLDLRVAKLTDHELIIGARKAAQDFIDRGENLLQYVQLNKRVERIRSVTNLN